MTAPHMQRIYGIYLSSVIKIVVLTDVLSKAIPKLIRLNIKTVMIP